MPRRDFRTKRILTIQLVDKSLFVSDAFVDGAWIGGSETFDVFGMFVETLRFGLIQN